MSAVFNTFARAMVTFHPTISSTVGGIIGGVVALEMALRVFKDLADIYGAHSRREDTYHSRLNLSKDLGGALFFGLLATNAVPYTAVIGATMFVVHSLFKGKTDYFTANAIKKVFTVATNIISKVWNVVYDRVLSPLWHHVIFPVGNLFVDLISWIFENAIAPILRALSRCIGHIIPRDPIWYGVIAVGLLIAGYHRYNPINLT